MILRSLALTNFKNISSANLEFSSKLNCLLGNNGMGKSNLLDAIHFLSFVRSYGRLSDNMLIKLGEDYAILNGKYDRKGVSEEITAGLRRDRRKTFKRGGKEYKRLSTHIGLLPAVMVAPADLALVTDSPEERRRFADMIISQSDAEYLGALIRYNQALEQRNRMLRDNVGDRLLYESVEMTLIAAADVITKRRREFVNELQRIILPYYNAISGNEESVSLAYSQSGADHSCLADALEHARSRDAILHHTSVGPHRDDILFYLNGMPLKHTASQGQTKTFTIALRFAQYDFLSKSTSIKPLLLLDDIFDKLDAGRVEQIINIVKGNGFGQIFITDTNRKHLDEIMSNVSGDYRMWSVDNGSFTPIQLQ